MAEDEGRKEDKFDLLTREGETMGYIFPEQARVLAMRHARDNTDFYGRAYSRISLVWEAISQDEGEDYYDIKLSFRPAGRFRGTRESSSLLSTRPAALRSATYWTSPRGWAGCREEGLAICCHRQSAWQRWWR